jgi:tetratricopeptide (TPR) repeat protein
MNPRRVWQHQFEDRSESQLSDAFGSVGWVVERLRHDYGEDLYARPFENGNPTGHDFFIQLKGTDDIQQYRISNEWLSRSVELSNLLQWSLFTPPVIFIIWDIVNKVGYWTHIQAFIKNKLGSNSLWLENKSGIKEPTRKVHVSVNRIITENNLDSLKLAIDAEWKKIEQGKRHFEILYQASADPTDTTLSPRLPKEIKQQLRITELRAIVTAKPNESKGWLDLAAAYYRCNNMPEALKAINKAWSIDPQTGNIRQVRACILAEFAIRNGGPASMFHEAISLFEASRSNPDDSMADYNIGNCYSELGKFQEAVTCYDEAITNEPNPHQAAQIWTNRGNAVDKIGNTANAIESFENAIRLHPKLWNAHASWAALEVRRENYEEACKHFGDAFECDPELQYSGDGIVYWYAYSLYKTERLKEALLMINQFLAVSPTHEEGLLLKAYLLNKLRQNEGNYFAEALAFFKNRLLDDPANMQIRSELHRLYIEQGLEEEHHTLLKETISYENAPPVALYEYAEFLEQESKIDEAIVFLERAVKQDEIDAQLYHSIAHTLARLKRETGCYDEAITYYKMALRNVNDPLPILEKMSECYHHLNDYVSCVVVLSQALMFGADGKTWWNNLSYALNKLGIIKTDLYKNFLQQKINNGDDFSENDVKEKLFSFMSKVA